MSRPENPVWRQAPFVRLLPPLIAGICWRLVAPPAASGFPRLFFLLAAALYAVYHFLPAVLRFRLQWVVAASVFLSLFVTGACLLEKADWQRHESFAGKYLTDSSFCVLTLDEPPVEKPNTWKAEATIREVINGQQVSTVKGRALLYFRKTGTAPSLQFGDRILIPGKLQPIRNSGNPGAFDYRSFCRRQHLYYRAFLGKDAWTRLPAGPAHPFRKFFFRCRDACLQVLATYIPGRREAGIAQALLLGYRGNLDKALLQSYANTGVVHIIAISGLHVGIIYGLLLMLLKILPRKRWVSLVKFLIIILALWSFAFITGAVPSVLRSTVMFTVMAAGTLLMNRPGSTVNGLAASAFLLLCYNPYWLLDVGFQLSYLAVGGILLFQPPFYRWLHVRPRIADFIWKIVTTTLAAQVLTLPLCLYYFHQFPLLFLLSNLAAVPLSSLVLFAELGLLVLSPLPAIAAWAGKMTAAAIRFLNFIIVGIDRLPYSRLDFIAMDGIGMLLCYLLILGLSLWLFRRSRKSCLAALLLVALLAGERYLKTAARKKQRAIIVYDIPRFTAIDLIDGRKACFTGDREVIQQASLYRYNLAPSRLLFQARPDTEGSPQLFTKGPYLQFYNKRLLLLDSSFKTFAPGAPLTVDYVIIRHDPPVSIKWIANHIACQCVIIDASNAPWRIEKWKSACEKLNLPCFSIPDKGAFVANLP